MENGERNTMFGMGLLAIRKIPFLLRAPGDAVHRQIDGGEVLDNPSAPSGHLPLHKGGFKIVGGVTPPDGLPVACGRSKPLPYGKGGSFLFIA